MGTVDVNCETSTENPGAGGVEMRLEVVVVPVSDVDRAKGFYQALGWRLDTDFASGGHAAVGAGFDPNVQCPF